MAGTLSEMRFDRNVMKPVMLRKAGETACSQQTNGLIRFERSHSSLFGFDFNFDFDFGFGLDPAT